MIFTTESGTKYILRGDKLSRISEIPLININSMNQEKDWMVEADKIIFDNPPTIGESFLYYHPRYHGCGSTPVVAIEYEDSDDVETL